MKERFSKIFELWNQRNVGFYKKCFNKLETENKTSFNYMAGIAPVMWMVFRKMYGWAAIIVLIFAGINTVQFALVHPTESVSGVISLLLYIVEFIIFGFLGNTLYYKHVKSKIAKGYSKIEGYNSVDPIWCVLYVILSILLGSIIPFFPVSFWVSGLVVGVVSLLIIAIPWAIECKSLCSQESVEPVEINEESVGKYLEKASAKNMFAAMWILIVGILLVGISTTVATKMVGNEIKDQLNKIAEEVSKVPNDSEKLDAKSNEVTAQLNKISKEIEQTEKNSESSEVSGAVAEIQNDNIDDQLANLADEIDKTLNDSKNSEVTEEIAEAEESDGTLNASENFDTSIQNNQNSDQSLDEDIDQD